MLKIMGKKLAAILVATSAISLSALSFTSQSALAARNNFRIVNNTSTDITRIYMSPSWSSYWTRMNENWWLNSGYYGQIFSSDYVANDCKYDIYLVFENDTHTVERVDICRYSSYSVND
jgi:hypothetical protein